MGAMQLKYAVKILVFFSRISIPFARIQETNYNIFYTKTRHVFGH